MSIVGAAGPVEWAWAVWAVVAIAVGVIALRRPRTTARITIASEVSPAGPGVLPYAAPDADRRFVPLLALAGVASFVAWVGAQMLYLSVRYPSVPTGQNTMTWSPADLATLSLVSAAVGWAVGLGLLAYGRGVPTIGLQFRRLPGGVVAGLLGIFVALPIVYFALEGALWLWSAIGVSHPPKHELLEVMEHGRRAWVRVAAVVSAAVAAPLFEEFLFRGCIQGGLRRSTGMPWVGVLIASILFTSIHPMWTMPPIFVFSVLLGIVYERTGNLWASTTMHALFNVFAILTSGLG